VNIHLKGAFGVESTAYEAKRRKKVALDIWYHPYIVRAALIEVDIVNAVWSRAPSTVLQKEQVDPKGVRHAGPCREYLPKRARFSPCDFLLDRWPV